MIKEPAYTDQTNGAQSPDVSGGETSKKCYHAPQLRDYGNLRDITMTTNTGTNYDAGAYPNVYTS